MAKYIRTEDGIFTTTGLIKDKYSNYWNSDNEVIFNCSRIIDESEDITELLKREAEADKTKINNNQ